MKNEMVLKLRVAFSKKILLTNLSESQNFLKKNIGDKLKAEMDKVSKEMGSKMGKFSSLIEEKNKIRAELDTEYEAMRNLRAEHRKAKDEFNVWYREEAARKKDLFKQRQQEERNEKLRVLAEKELERAAIPAFTDEIALCGTLTTLLSAYLPNNNETEKTEEKTEKTSINPTDLPAGAVMLAKKSDRDDDFFVGKKSKKGNNNKKSGNSNANTKVFKLDVELIDQFSKLQINIPVTVADIPKALEDLVAKKKYYKENQETKTLEAQAMAREKIEQLKKKAEAGEALNDSTETLDKDEDEA